MIRHALACLFIFWASTAGSAEDQAVFPETCAPRLTVQAVDCTVTHYATCETDGGGGVMQVRFNGAGVRETQILDADNHPLRIFSGAVDLAFDQTTPADRMSSSVLLSEGADGYAFTMSSARGPIRRMTFFGNDELIAEPFSANGFSFQKLRGRYVRTLHLNGGTVTIAVEAEQYVAETFGFFVPIKETQTQMSRKVMSDQTPVDFLKPGDAGFLSARPLYCDPGASS